jgi:hypothetical protein
VPVWIARFSRELKSKTALSTRRFKAGLHFPALNQISPFKGIPGSVSVSNLNAISLQKTEGFPMADARCSCGALTLTLPEPSKLVVACHCLDCQRRTGAPFGVGAFYPVDAVAISGTPKEFTRDAASGGKVHTYFCPNCGSTIYWKADNLPSLIGVAVGALADPKYPAPIRSVFEQSKHDWVQIDGAVEHFQQSSAAKNSN